MPVVAIFVTAHGLYRIAYNKQAQIVLRKPTVLIFGFLALFGIYTLARTDPLFNRYGFPIAVAYLKSLTMAILLVLTVNDARDLNTIAVYGVAGATAGSLISFTSQQTRATVPGINPNLMGFVLVLGIVLCVFVYVHSKTVISQRLLKLFGASMGVGVLLSGSRGAYLALFTFVSMSVVFFWPRIRSIATANRGKVAYSVIIASTFAAVGSYLMAERIAVYIIRIRRLVIVFQGADALQKLDSASLLTRYELHQTGLQMFLRRPLFGYGFGAFRSYAGSHEPLLSPVGPHSFYLSTISQLGLIGAALFAVPVVLIFKLAFTRCHYDTVPQVELHRLLILLAGFVALLVQGVAVDVFRWKQSWILIGFLLAHYEIATASTE